MKKLLFVFLFSIFTIFFISVPSASAENLFPHQFTIKQIIESPYLKSMIGDIEIPIIKTVCSFEAKRDVTSCGLSQVLVDKNFTADDNTVDDIFGFNVFNTIQEGVNAVDDGGTVYINSGTYTEHVTLDRNVSLVNNNDFYYEEIGSPLNAPKIVAPDCTAITVESQNEYMEVVGGLEIDGNDSGHTCESPLIDMQDNSFQFFFFDTIENSKTAIRQGDATLVASFFDLFNSNEIAINTTSVNSYSVDSLNYWGDNSGPYEANNNSSGLGGKIIGARADKVIYRPYVIGYPDQIDISSTTINSSEIASLLSNGGTFATGFDTENDASQIFVNDNITINFPTHGGESSVVIPGYPGFFSLSYTLMNHEEANFDATAFTAEIINSNISGIPENKKAITAIEFGVPGVQLDVYEGDPTEVNLFVGNSYNGEVLNVYRSESLHDGWTTEGLESETCEVADGMCTFYTNSYSYFVAVGKVKNNQSSGSYARGYTPGVVSILPVIKPNVVTTPAISPIRKVLEDLKLGMHNSDVEVLQQFLIDQNKGIASTALKNVGKLTNYFGNLTRASLAEWQNTNNVSPASGYFGARTRAKIIELGL